MRAFALFFICAALTFQGAKAQTILGRVVRVADGDTITILTSGNQQVRIRLAWIDAPELGQAFGNVSREALAELVAGKNVQVEEHDVDRYGRTVGTVFVDGYDACLAQVQAGLAWVYDYYIRKASTNVQSQYYDAQEKARGAREGLWHDDQPVPPWEYRKSLRSALTNPLSDREPFPHKFSVRIPCTRPLGAARVNNRGA
jgi:endonuclease YncB( thermonuclease family)